MFQTQPRRRLSYNWKGEKHVRTFESLRGDGKKPHAQDKVRILGQMPEPMGDEYLRGARAGFAQALEELEFAPRVHCARGLVHAEELDSRELEAHEGSRSSETK